jgi:hypothetical protein
LYLGSERPGDAVVGSPFDPRDVAVRPYKDSALIVIKHAR